MQRERDIHQALVDRVKLLGGTVRRLRWIGRSRAPDVLILFAGRHVLVEEKRPGKDAEDGQKREHVRLRAAGFEVLVVDTVELIDAHFPLP